MGHEQRGARYAVVVQASRLQYLTTRLVVPTSGSAVVRGKARQLHPPLDFGYGECVASVDQLRVVDAQAQLGELVGYVSGAELHAIEHALTFILELRI